jgi:hypothetical protein
VVAAAAGVLALALPANAAPPGAATITRSIVLAASSAGAAYVPGPTASDPPRSIYLAPGDYTFGYTLVGPNSVVRSDTYTATNIAGGYYTWYCGIEGDGHAYPAVNYLTYCQIQQLTDTDDETYTVPRLIGGARSFDQYALAPGTYTWQGYIQQLVHP